MSKFIDFPKDWRKVSLDELGFFIRGQGGNRSDEEKNGLPCIRYGDLYTHHGCVVRSFCSFISEISSNYYTPLKYGDVIFSGSGETFEEIGKATAFCSTCHAYVGGDTIIFRPSFEIDPYFLGYALNSVDANRFKAQMGQGSSVIHITSNHLKRLKIALPPLHEQKHVGKILSTVDEAIEQTEALISKIKQVKAGLMHDLFTRGIGPDSRLRPPKEKAPELYKETELGWIPRDWSVKFIFEIGQVVTGRTPPSQIKDLWGDYIPFISPTEINEDGFVINPERYVSKKGSDFVNILPSKAILVVCIGSTIGKVGLSPWICSTNQQINAVLGFSEAINPVYAKEAIRQHINQIYKWSGLQAVPIVKKSQFEKMRIPLALGAEQFKISNYIKSINTRLQIEYSSLNKLKKVRQSLMQDLLTGHVRVPIPDEEEPQESVENV